MKKEKHVSNYKRNGFNQIVSFSKWLNDSIPVPCICYWTFTWLNSGARINVKGYDFKNVVKLNFTVFGLSEWYGLELSAEIVGHEVVIKPINA